jgi:hypothetical protein
MLFWKFNLGLYDLSGADRKLLPVLASGRPGPPEIIGGHDPTGYYALAIKNHPIAERHFSPSTWARFTICTAIRNTRTFCWI